MGSGKRMEVFSGTFPCDFVTSRKTTSLPFLRIFQELWLQIVVEILYPLERDMSLTRVPNIGEINCYYMWKIYVWKKSELEKRSMKRITLVSSIHRIKFLYIYWIKKSLFTNYSSRGITRWLQSRTTSSLGQQSSSFN